MIEEENSGEVTGPDGKTDRSVMYDIWGRQRGVTDGNGSTTLYTRDRAGRVTTVEKPDGSREHYSYDYAGNITEGTDGNGNVTQFLYNGAGLPEMIRKADGTERLFGYDSEERCTFRRDENGNTIRMCHNLDGSMVLASGTPEGSAVPSVSSTYRYDERGFLTSAAEGNTVYRYKRDSEGRVTEKSDSRGKLFEIRYNPDGTIDRLGGTRYYYILTTDEICREYRANRKAVYFLMRLCTPYYTERSVLSTAQYNYAGQLTCVMPDGGTEANYEYDNNGVLIRTECRNVNNPG